MCFSFGGCIGLKRIEALRKLAFKNNASYGYLILNNVSMTYFIGFQGPNAMLIPQKVKASFTLTALTTS